ncbi:MAG: hypothetical protein OXN84_22210 [Albidovulum sp.]|nr:hypothetical protein [Albidovulum sp.]
MSFPTARISSSLRETVLEAVKGVLAVGQFEELQNDRQPHFAKASWQIFSQNQEKQDTIPTDYSGTRFRPKRPLTTMVRAADLVAYIIQLGGAAALYE